MKGFIKNTLQNIGLIQHATNLVDLIRSLMDDDLQQSWIAEFQRILKKSGYLLISTHGKHYFDHMSDIEQKQFLAGNLVIRSSGAIGSNRFAAYHPLSYLKNLMPSELTFVDFIEKGAKGNPHQDLYLFRKKED